MISFRDVQHPVRTRDALVAAAGELALVSRLHLADRDAATAVLVSIGELCAALADAWSPQMDELTPELADVTRTGASVGRLFTAVCRAEARGAAEHSRSTLADIGKLLSRTLPERVSIRAPEGFAYYAVYPEAYAAAADQLAKEMPPRSVVVVGLRSIGATLAFVAAAALENHGWSADVVTLRPRGHPFDRRPVIGDALRSFLAERPDRLFLIVDEGPGLSGSSFCGTAALLSDLGVPESRIVFAPSHVPRPDAFVSEEARMRWGRHRIVHVTFERVIGQDGMFDGAVEFSAGGWRPFVCGEGQPWPAVQPQHERRKYLRREESGRCLLLKFSGLGRYGAERRILGERLAEGGFVPPVVGLQRGFLLSAFVSGRPLEPSAADDDLLSFAVRYLSVRARIPHRVERPDLDALFTMIETNVRSGLGEAALGQVRNLERLRSLLSNVPAVAVDGRLLPQEFLRTKDRILKADALDHHDDHFFPGPCDIAWDVAGFATEFALAPGATREFGARVAQESGDPDLMSRLGVYTVAYAAFRLGYVVMALQALQRTPDGRRFSALEGYYASRLEQGLALLGSQ